MEFRLLLCVTREHEPRHGYERNDEHDTHCDAPMENVRPIVLARSAMRVVDFQTARSLPALIAIVAVHELANHAKPH
jgi:hypothetical protein